jgi:hypothetical protein
MATTEMTNVLCSGVRDCGEYRNRVVVPWGQLDGRRWSVPFVSGAEQGASRRYYSEDDAVLFLALCEVTNAPPG